jgi:hypothetical protein
LQPTSDGDGSSEIWVTEDESPMEDLLKIKDETMAPEQLQVDGWQATNHSFGSKMRIAG